MGSLTSDEKLYEIAEIGRDRRKDSGNFAVEPVCKCLYVLDTHNVMAVFIFTIIILLIFVATIHNWGASHCKGEREKRRQLQDLEI